MRAATVIGIMFAGLPAATVAILTLAAQLPTWAAGPANPGSGAPASRPATKAKQALPTDSPSGQLPPVGSLAEDLAEGERLAAEAARDAAAEAAAVQAGPSDSFVNPAATIPDPLASLAASDPATVKAQAEFAAAIEKAEAAYKAARRAAAEKRLAFVKQRVAYHTSQGDFEKATVAKAAQVQLETSGVDVVRPRPTDTVRFGGHVYALVKSVESWHVARTRCEEMGGHLVTLEKPQEAAFIQQMCINIDWAWAGATDEEIEGKWTWVTGAKVPFGFAFASDQVGAENYMAVGRNGIGDIDSAGKWWFVCEWDN